MKPKAIILSFFLWIASQFGFSQDCILDIVEFTKQLDYELDTMSEAEFLQIESMYQMNVPVNIEPFSEVEFVRQYPNIFKSKENGYAFSSLDGDLVQVSNIDTLEKSKEFQQYRFLGKFCDFAVIYKLGYESWSYLYVDLKDGRVFSTEGKPNTRNCEFVYSTSNYYGEGMFEVIDIVKKRELALRFDLWDTEKLINIDHEFYLKIYYFGQCDNSTRYIKIKIL